MTYRAIGSSSGQTEFIGDGSTDYEPYSDFGSGDIPLDTLQHNLIESNGGKTMHVPIAVGAVSVFHNAALSKDTPLKLSPCVLAKIFTGAITRWDHAEIVSENAHMKNAKHSISVIHRAKGSSSTAGLTNYLHLACPTIWTAGPQSKSDEFPAGALAVSGSDGMVAGLERTGYSIGYLDAGTGTANGLTEVMLKNKDGNYYISTEADISDAVSDLPTDLTADFGGVSAYYKDGAKVWPIVAITYVYVRVDQTGKGPTAALLRAFLDYCLSSVGQTALVEEFGFEALPTAVITSIKNGLSALEMPFISPTFTIESADTVDVNTGAGEFVISAKRGSFDDYERGVLRKQIAALQARLDATTGIGGMTASEVQQLVEDEYDERDNSNAYLGLSIAALVISMIALLVAATGRSGGKGSKDKASYLADADPVRANDSRDASGGSVARV
jgi:ABC-type phosphate transport system substrate-binding protein